MSPPSRQLIDALDAKKWPTAISLLPSAPDLTYRDVNNWNALHWCCVRRAPTPVLKMILQLCPPAAKIARDDEGHTPLLKAIEKFSDDERVLMMIDGCSEASFLQDRDGWTPLHKAIVWGRSVEVMSQLAMANPGAVNAVDTYGDTPLSIFFRDWNMGLRGVMDYLCNGMDAASVEVLDRMGRGKPLIWIYEVAALLLRTLFYLDDLLPTIESEDELPLAALVLPTCPWSFFSFMLKMHPDAACWDDEETGNYLLHWALLLDSSTDGDFYKCGVCKKPFGCGSWYQHRKRNYDEYCRGCFMDSVAGVVGSLSDFFEVHPVLKPMRAIDEIVTLNPNIASFPNQTGKLPLCSSIEHVDKFSMTNVAALYAAAPQALLTRDMETHMYPFMTSLGADIHPDDDDYLSSFSICFALLTESAALMVTLTESIEMAEDVNVMAMLPEYCESSEMHMTNGENLAHHFMDEIDIEESHTSPQMVVDKSDGENMPPRVTENSALAMKQKPATTKTHSKIPGRNRLSLDSRRDANVPIHKLHKLYNKSRRSLGFRNTNKPRVRSPKNDSDSATAQTPTSTNRQGLKLSESDKRQRMQTMGEELNDWERKVIRSNGSFNSTYTSGLTEPRPFRLSQSRSASRPPKGEKTMAERLVSLQRNGFGESVKDGASVSSVSFTPRRTEPKPFRLSQSRSAPRPSKEEKTLAESLAFLEQRGFGESVKDKSSARSVNTTPIRTEPKPFNLSQSRSVTRSSKGEKTLAESLVSLEQKGFGESVRENSTSRSGFTPGRTEPKPFNLSQSRSTPRPKDKKTLAETLASLEQKGFGESVKDNSNTRSRNSLPIITYPQPFNLSQSRSGSRRASQGDTEILTVGESMLRSERIGLRGSLTRNTSYTPTVTRPQSPKLSKSTNHKSRINCKSALEREEEELKYMADHQFKARSVGKAVLSSRKKSDSSSSIKLRTKEEVDNEECKKQFRARRMPDLTFRPLTKSNSKSPTKPNPFRLSQKRHSPSDTVAIKKFQAMPMPDFKKLEKLKKKLLSRMKKRHRSRSLEQINRTSLSSVDPTPAPFTLQTEVRGKTHEAKQKERLKKEKAERRRKAATKARPVPQSHVKPFTFQPASFQITAPTPFNMEGMKRHEDYQSNFQEKIKQEEESVRRQACFKAKAPLSVAKPFTPQLPSQSGRSPLEHSDFELHSSIQAEQRNQSIETRRQEIEEKEEWERKQEEERLKEEEEDIQRLRRTSVAEGGMIPVAKPINAVFGQRRKSKIPDMRQTRSNRQLDDSMEIDDLVTIFGSVNLRL